MLERKIEKALEAWKASPNKNPLVIKGQRQCGKTFSVLEFAKRNYENVIYINFLKNPNYSAIFGGSLEVDNIVMLMSAVMGAGQGSSVMPGWYLFL